jgi:hypothetical protein
MNGKMKLEDCHCLKQEKGGGAEVGLCFRGRDHSMNHHSINPKNRNANYMNRQP